MGVELKPGRGEEALYATQHFQIRISEDGEGLLELLGVNDMIMDGPITDENARRTVCAAETGYHHGFRAALRAIAKRNKGLEEEFLGPITTPRGELRPATKDIR